MMRLITISLAIRTDVFDMDAPWSSVTVERSMPSLKFYHDFSAGLLFFSS